jgi:hypothetical protein
MTLTWRSNPDDSPVNRRHYHTSACGRYSVAKEALGKDALGYVWVYLAWRGSQQLGQYGTADAAKAACQRHADEQEAA